MPINKGIQTADVSDHFLTGPGRGGRVVTQMAHRNDFGGAGPADSIDSELDIIVKGLTVISAGDTVAKVAVFILKIGRCGLYNGFRCGNSDESHDFLAEMIGLKGFQKVFTPNAVLLMVEIAGKIGKFRFPRTFQEDIHAVVKFVVSRRCQIIACFVHQLEDRSALIHRTKSGSLQVIPRVHKQDISVLLLQILFQGTDGIETQGTVNIRMGVIGVQNHNIIGFFRVGRGDGNAQQNDQQYGAKN